MSLFDGHAGFFKKIAKDITQNHETTNKEWKHQIPVEWLYGNIWSKN